MTFLWKRLLCLVNVIGSLGGGCDGLMAVDCGVYCSGVACFAGWWYIC